MTLRKVPTKIMNILQRREVEIAVKIIIIAIVTASGAATAHFTFSNGIWPDQQHSEPAKNLFILCGAISAVILWQIPRIWRSFPIRVRNLVNKKVVAVIIFLWVLSRVPAMLHAPESSSLADIPTIFSIDILCDDLPVDGNDPIVIDDADTITTVEYGRSHIKVMFNKESDKNCWVAKDPSILVRSDYLQGKTRKTPSSDNSPASLEVQRDNKNSFILSNEGFSNSLIVDTNLFLPNASSGDESWKEVIADDSDSLTRISNKMTHFSYKQERDNSIASSILYREDSSKSALTSSAPSCKKDNLKGEQKGENGATYSRVLLCTTEIENRHVSLLGKLWADFLPLAMAAIFGGYISQGPERRSST